MRPTILNPLFAELSGLPGVGAKTERLIARVAGLRVVDLLWLLPHSVIDRSARTQVREADDGAIATLTVSVLEHRPPRLDRLPYRVLCADETGSIDLVFFHVAGPWLERTLPVGSVRTVSGRIDFYQGRPRMSHPDYILAPEKAHELALHEPVYPLTAGLGSKALARAMRGALARVPALPEWQDEAWRRRSAFAPFKEALLAAHAPTAPADLAADAPPRARLAYDELLANQLALALVRQRVRRQPGPPLRGTGALVGPLRRALPYRLTRAQERSVAEILADMAGPHRMMRLLQGDVGSGKTVVALIALLTAVEAGAQGALMAPTEILAHQHHATMAPLVAAAGGSLVLLTGRSKGRAREEALAALRDGRTQLVVGTHALIQEDVAFANLGLAVVDEQHRFGVHDRLALAGKGGSGTHVLVMTATPIPRTLTLSLYGDLDISRLDEKPPGRKPVTTRAIPDERLDEVIDAIARALQRNERVYWVCPLVEESTKIDLAAAEARHRGLAEAFGPTVGLVHGRQSAAVKDRTMRDFAAGRIQLLVATTVIEVGVDVPEATIMVIEHAERFGLAQLHQLRGRVGRGVKAGSCLLLYHRPLGETARARLAILRETDDGFRLAEEDLRLRGAGEVLGVRQSGLPAFKIARMPEHETLLAAAHDDAAMIMARDPLLTSPRGDALRTLLYLFERDAAIKLLRSG